MDSFSKKLRNKKLSKTGSLKKKSAVVKKNIGKIIRRASSKKSHH